MTPEQKIKVTILTGCGFDKEVLKKPLETSEQIETAWEEAQERDYLCDWLYEFRQGEMETDIGGEYNRNFESKSVAAKMFDGSWVGWTYWYGGGKHGCPEDMPWMQDAYELSCVETQEMVTVRKWTIKK